MPYQAVIGLEVHAELQTRSKMFCACPVVDSISAAPNTAVCPVCEGLPGVLPVVNRQAVDYGLRVALALECVVAPRSLFARKNYFYPDLPKGYQISQYEYPLAEHGTLPILTDSGEVPIRIRRVHLEEDTGKLTHVTRDGESYSLVDLNRAGVALLEIVSEPDMHTVEEVRAYATGLRVLLRYLGVNSGDMEKGVIRFEANVSVRPAGQASLNPRVEIKNLNSFRSLERAVAYEIERQSRLLDQGESPQQETLGWNEAEGVTFSQRSKEEAHDYRYFPEPDLPPLVVEPAWVEQVQAALPELPVARYRRLMREFSLSHAEALNLTLEPQLAATFEVAARAAVGVPYKTTFNWVTGELAALLNQHGLGAERSRVTPQELAALLQTLQRGDINIPTAKAVLAEMFATGKQGAQIISARGLEQVSDAGEIAALVAETLADHPAELASYRSGKEALSHWFFGQVMQRARGKANPAMLRAELVKQLHGSD